MNVKKIFYDAVQANGNNADLFFLELFKVSNRLGISFDWLCNAIWSESRFKSTAYNKNGAAGLIQFVQSTALGIGTNIQAIRKMTNIEQLPYVERYLKSQIITAGKPKDWIDTYCLIFQPAWVGKPDTAVLKSNAYLGNSYIDQNKDKIITKAEFRIWANKQIPNAQIITDVEPKK